MYKTLDLTTYDLTRIMLQRLNIYNRSEYMSSVLYHELMVWDFVGVLWTFIM